MAGATCLEAMARTIEDGIVPLILPFVTQVTHTDTYTHSHTHAQHILRMISHTLRLPASRFNSALTFK